MKKVAKRNVLFGRKFVVCRDAGVPDADKQIVFKISHTTNSFQPSIIQGLTGADKQGQHTDQEAIKKPALSRLAEGGSGMIRYVRVDYVASHRPGIPVMTCNARGKIIFEREGMSPTKKDVRRALAHTPDKKGTAKCTPSV